VTLATPLDLDARPPTHEEQEQGWRSAVRHRLVAMELRATDPLAPPASFRERDLGDLLITDWGTPPLDAVRGKRMAADDEDTLLLLTARDGEMELDLADRTAVLRPGSVMLLRSRLSARIVVPGWLSKRSVRVPMSALTPFDMGSGVPDFLSVDTAHSPLSWLLLDFLTGVDRQHDRLDAGGVEASRTALLTLIAGIVRTSQTSAGRAGDLLPVLRQQMETWIAGHLAEGVVRVRDLASAFNVAPRTVHRAFAATGDTLGSVVRAHRLAAARDDLVRTTLSVAAIAYRWGFCDASHLGREFRREMSMSPGDYRDAYGIA
jgi:AraC family transcriptional activator of tynA and feaB